MIHEAGTIHNTQLAFECQILQDMAGLMLWCTMHALVLVDLLDQCLTSHLKVIHAAIEVGIQASIRREQFERCHNHWVLARLRVHAQWKPRFLPPQRQESLRWLVRHKVTLGFASTLCYLHQGWGQCVVYCNIDQAQQLYAGFGIQRELECCRPCKTRGPWTWPADDSFHRDEGLHGPEYFFTSNASKESDVYSFGIVTLEIACRRRTIEPMEHPSKVRLVEWLWEH